MLVLTNLMEEAVLKVLDEVLEKETTVCKCEQCRLDIAAIALNNLPPRYVATSKGSSYARVDSLEMQKYIDIMGAISKGVSLVKEHPRH